MPFLHPELKGGGRPYTLRSGEKNSKAGIMRRKWHSLGDEQLLDLRLCDLPLRIKGSVLEERVNRLYFELEERGIRFKPHVWLAQEWFSPDGIPGIAIPFYLAHPRLMKLERKQMLEVEGGSEQQCMRILRHEAGHALDTAYRLHFRRNWRDLFGSFASKYPDSYKPDPNSRKYVLHLNAWYAQAHPAEDWAETFAVWLTPGGRWRNRYKGWPALAKLEYVDNLMAEISGEKAKNNRRDKVEPISELTITLREHYRLKRSHYSFEWPAFYDRDLRRIFSDNPELKQHPTAASFLRREGPELCRLVSRGTGLHTYTVNHVLQDMVERCRDLKLRVASEEEEAWHEVLVLLTVQTMNVVHSGYYRVAV